MDGILIGIIAAVAIPVVVGILCGAIQEYKAHRDRRTAYDENNNALATYQQQREFEEGNAGIDRYANYRTNMVVGNTTINHDH